MAALTQLFYEDWANLPDVILVHVFSYLPMTDIIRAGDTCRHWFHCSKAPQVWRYIRFTFSIHESRNSDNSKWVMIYELYSRFIHFIIFIFPETIYAENRKNAISVLEKMSSLENIHLKSLSIVFHGKYPPFCDDNEFLMALEKLLNRIGEDNERCVFKTLNLNGLQGQFSDDFIEKISANFPNLEYLNILTKSFDSRYSPFSIINLVSNCNQLQELHLSYASLSYHIMKALAQTGRTPLKRMELACNGQLNNYEDALSPNAWSQLHRAIPNLKVTLRFDYRCPSERILEIIQPEIPVHELVFMSIAILDKEINIAVSYYGDRLEKLIIDSWPLYSLSDKSVLNVARRCKKLKSLHVICLHYKNVIDEVLKLSPLLRETRSYSLN